MRQGAAIWEHHQPRPQREQAALERQSASGSRQSGSDHEAHARVHVLPAQRQSRQSVVDIFHSAEGIGAGADVCLRPGYFLRTRLIEIPAPAARQSAERLEIRPAAPKGGYRIGACGIAKAMP